MKLAQIGIALMLAASTAAPAFAADAPVVASGEALGGTAGVCIRWGEDRDHVAQAVVVQSTGNVQLDEVIASSVKTMNWPAPGEGYAGQWVGVSLSVGGAPPISTLPNCALLDAPAVPGSTAS
ncbi:hypothetical protein QO010_004676 [Caulobacter ginsengisoli]|uniref:TonB C-terminal domain-containing protein n=1 Tax=Caulobacter ginsengisoli TaxID=400775 RepID=A0ABU0IY00_9CAUL|nr:hypothetical protein [Caulobacter ginsengisoli]MDQ0466879.1 hypothetical protein [Caulobacter ginsengisoli]